MKDRLNIRVGGVQAGRTSNLGEEIDVFLLAMKNEDSDSQHCGVDSKDNHSRGTSKTRSERGTGNESIRATVEKDGQRTGQNDAKQGDDPYHNTEYACLDGGAKSNSAIQFARQEAGASRLPARKQVRRKLIGRGIHVRGNGRIRNGHAHVNLGSAALRTKRPSVFDLGSAFLAGVLHVIEASALRSAEQGNGSGY